MWLEDYLINWQTSVAWLSLVIKSCPLPPPFHNWLPLPLFPCHSIKLKLIFLKLAMHLFIRFQSAGLLKQLPIEPDPTTEALMLRFRLDSKMLMKKKMLSIGKHSQKKGSKTKSFKMLKKTPLIHAFCSDHSETYQRSYEFLTSFKAGGLLG